MARITRPVQGVKRPNGQSSLSDSTQGKGGTENGLCRFYRPGEKLGICPSCSEVPLENVKEGNDMCRGDYKGKREEKNAIATLLGESSSVTMNPGLLGTILVLSVLFPKKPESFPCWIINFLAFLLSVYTLARLSKVFIKTLQHKVFSLHSVWIENNFD